ncbi:MAG: hypothetical protein GX986_00865 [Firmicutes bacterium]|mgnify:CR=1 FL=1|nr:hypothetical protein [Bacillota bacterium]
MRNNIQQMSQEFATRMRNMGDRPNPQAIGAAVQEFVSSCMEAASQERPSGRRRRERDRDNR